MKKQTMMSPREINNATFNIRQIEKALGHPIPPGYFDATNYSDRFLTSGEAFTIAHDIKEMEKARRFDHPSHNTPNLQGSGSSSGIEILIFILYLVIGGIICLFKG